jgi:hypothetical protein
MSTSDQFEVEVEDEEKGVYKMNIDLGKKPLEKKKWLERIGKYKEKIVLAASIVLIAAISFEAGFLKGEGNRKEPIVVNQPACAPCPKVEKNANVSADSSLSQSNSQKKVEVQPSVENQECAFVASKNSNKYHLPTCQWAMKIKPENRICFSSKEEAEKRGYQPAKCCIK